MLNININKLEIKHNEKKLVNISFDILDSTALIGESGSGKSTIIDILCGFHKNNLSKLIVDDLSILESDNLASWQNLIGYVPQNIVIFNQSLRENILFGSENKIVNDDVIKNLIKKVDLEKFLLKAKNGLSQVLRQDGQNISGGEKQRIGIARALYNKPEVLIFDEATSALDAEIEEEILNEIKKLQKDFTLIFISHRKSSLSYCDEKYLLKDKKLIKN